MEESGGGADATLVASLVYLVSLALHAATPALVNAQCEEILGCVSDAVVHAGGAGGVSRHAAAVIASTLALVDGQAWARPAVQRAYLRLVALAADSDPKTRRRGREALQSLVDGPRGTLISARTSTACAAYLVTTMRALDALVGEGIDAKVIDGHSAPTKLIHLITSIAVVVPSFRAADATAVAKELVVMASLNLPHVTVFAYNTLATMFDMRDLRKSRQQAFVKAGGGEEMEDDRDEDDADIGPAAELRTVIPTSHLGKIAIALAELPLSSDAQEEAVVAFATALSRAAVTYFEAHSFSPPPADSMVLTVKALVDCLDPSVARLATSPKISRALTDVVELKWLQARPEVFSALEPLFGYRFKAIWLDALAPLRKYLEQDGCAGKLAMADCLEVFTKHVVSMREKAFASKDRATQGVTNSILGAILRGGGVQIVLGAVPLERVKKLLLSNAWLLPVLHQHVRYSPIAMFASHIRPLADELTARSAEATDGGRVVEGKNASMLATQLWDLLPAFCHTPSDIAQDVAIDAAFDAISTCLVPGSDFAIRQSAFGGLRALSISVSNLPSEDSGTAGAQKRFGKGLKKIFSSLCLVVEETAADRRGAALDAITKAIPACGGDSKLVTGLLRKSVMKLLEASVDDAEAESASAARHAATDVATAIAESGAVPKDSAEIDFLERAMSPLFLDPSDTGLQKKAYRAASLLVSLGVIGKDEESGLKFITETGAAASSVATSAKGTRLSLVQALVEMCKSSSTLLEACTSSFLPEVILCTRDVSEKTRAAAFGTLSAMARTWYAVGDGGAGKQADGLRQFVTRVAAGLAGRTVTMLAATLTSLSHVVYAYRGEAAVFEDLAHDIDALFAMGDQPGPVSILLRHNSREVQKAALGTIKMATSALSTGSPDRLIRILPAILPGLVTVAAQSRKKETRLRVRVILERLLRKCGRDEVESVFPAEHAKLLAAVRKQYSRDMTKKHEKRELKRATAAADAAAEKSAKIPVDGSDSDEGDDDKDSDMDLFDSDDSDIEKEILDGDELASRPRVARPKNSRSGELLVGDKVVDLLETRVADGFMTRGEVAEESKRAMAEQKKLERRSASAKDTVTIADDGRPIFAESDSDGGVAHHGSVAGDDDDEGAAGKKKRKRGVTDGGHRAKKVKGSFGSEYRSRRGAAGDMKRPGMPDPYAYIPLCSGVGGDVSKALVQQGGQRKGAKGSKKGRLGGRRGVPARR